MNGGDNMATVWKHYDKFDSETGEFIGTGAIPIKEPDFVKIYIATLLETMKEMEMTSEIAVFIAICKFATYGSGEELPVAYIGDYEITNTIAPSTNLSKTRIYTIIKKLIEKELLRKVGKGRYQINPFYVAKGPWSSVQKMQITWDKANGTCDIRFIKE